MSTRPDRDSAFSMLRHFELPDFLKVICNEMIDGTPDPVSIQRILKEYEIGPEEANQAFLSYIIESTWSLLYWLPLRKEEFDTAIYLKKLFSIKRGDFMRYRKREIADLIQVHRYKTFAYKRGDFGKKEGLKLVSDAGLRRIFDLGINDWLRCLIEPPMKGMFVDRKKLFEVTKEFDKTYRLEWHTDAADDDDLL